MHGVGPFSKWPAPDELKECVRLDLRAGQHTNSTVHHTGWALWLGHFSFGVLSSDQLVFISQTPISPCYHYGVLLFAAQVEVQHVSSPKSLVLFVKTSAFVSQALMSTSSTICSPLEVLSRDIGWNSWMIELPLPFVHAF